MHLLGLFVMKLIRVCMSFHVYFHTFRMLLSACAAEHGVSCFQCGDGSPEHQLQ